jgi:hypothetical protein
MTNLHISISRLGLFLAEIFSMGVEAIKVSTMYIMFVSKYYSLNYATVDNNDIVGNCL